MKVILRRAGIVVGSIVALLVVVACVGFFLSERHVSRRYVVEAESIPIPTDSLSIERGRHLARAIAKCADCHTATLAGQVFIDNAALGRFVPLNLTRGKGGLGSMLKDADWVRAIRHGVGHDGRALRIMPSDEFQHLSVGDLGAIIAYAKSVAPVDNELPPNTLGPLTRALLVTNQMPLFARKTSTTRRRARLQSRRKRRRRRSSAITSRTPPDAQAATAQDSAAAKFPVGIRHGRRRPTSHRRD
jgi:hypothetical protein